uniref:AAA+ ATPase domain-containing protein n=1 Tax=Oryza barthii TaxID=65489 RepID=A0A0D3FGH9_9ORYZ
MGGSADPEAPTPTPSPSPSPSPSPAKATPSPASADGNRLRRCVQSKLSWGPPKAGGGGGEAGGAGLPPLAAGDGTPEKVKKRGRPRKSEAGKKPSSNRETTGLEQDSKDEVILVDESPQKKQRKGRGKNQGAALKVPNRKHCKALESTDGHESCQQLRSSQTQAVLPQKSPTSVDIDLVTGPSEASPVNDNVDALDNEDKPQLIVDLRSEANIAAEENRRLSSGKKMHPFFASRKIHKGAGQDILNVEDEDMDSLCAFERDPPLCPVHVLYELEVTMPIHWSNKWLIADKSFLGTSTTEQNSAEHADPGKHLANFHDKQNKSKFSSQDVIDVDDECLLASSSCFHASLFESKQHERVQHELPEVTPKGCQTANLWTDKYRPETAAQVCGNSEHVKFLNEWLKGWDERGHRNKQNIVTNGSMNGRSCQDGSDTDYSEDASDYENVLLITGPVGCGKSAAVFACAREQGFNVIEVNTSDMRNGAYVRQKFEEATKSHGLEKWSQEEIIGLPISNSLDPASGTPGTAEYKQVINKTLILFEDVDTVFDEDRGFISTILKMVETTKWPIILTSNKKDPPLPHLLAQLVLDFTYPSSAELLSHVDMICKSEGVEITVPQQKHIIDAFLGRLNKCLSCPSLLDLDAVHSTVPRIVPWDFPCKLSETIYMEIDKTIVTAEQKKKQMEVSEFEGLELQIMTPLTKGRSAGKTRKPKKSKLKHGRSADCNDASPCKNDLDDFHDSPDIPLPSNHQRMRNRRGVVLFAESDDDLADAHAAKDATFTVQEGRLLPQSSELPCLYGHGISNIVPESVFFQQSFVPHLHREVISNQLCFPSESRAFEPASSFQNQLESNMPGSISQICDTFMSQGISCVPESSFMVGGTSASISSDDLLSSLVSNGLSALRNESTYTASVVALEDTNKVENQMTDEPQKCMEDEVGETCEAYVELADRNDHASCSITGYQLMDECSRAESVWLLSGKKNNDSCKVEHVQDTWNRLRRCHPVLPCDMNHNRSVSGALKRVSRVSDLISESDLMLISCHPFSNDISDPSLTPYTESDGFSYSKQLEMGSIYAQHGLCIFLQDSQATDDGFVDLLQELLFSGTTTTSLGKFVSSGISCGDGSGNISHVKYPTSCISKRRERQARLREVLLPVVPPKLSQSLRGPAFVDYLSSMSQISQLENMQLSECKASSKQRRCRQPRHYLSSGALSLSAEDIGLLAQCSTFSDRRESETIIEQAIS